METIVFCKKYQEELPAMTFPPLPGPAGKELLETVSQKAFDAWKSHQTTLINERRMDLSNPEKCISSLITKKLHKQKDLWNLQKTWEYKHIFLLYQNKSLC